VGADFVRVDFRWDQTELAEKSFDWSSYDKVAKEAAAVGLRMWWTMDYSNKWVSVACVCWLSLYFCSIDCC